MNIKQQIKTLLKRVPLSFTKNQAYDRQTKKVIQKICSQNSTCFDVGSYKGEILAWFCKYAPGGTHFAFEPIPHLAHELEEKFKNQCVIHSIALSNTNGESEFHFVKSNPSYSGLRKRRYDRKNEAVNKIIVKTARLDDLIKSDTKIDLMKIDVEGAELLVLKGAEKSILRNKPFIIFECGKGALDFYNSKPQEVFDFLTKKLGYQVSTMKKWLSKTKELSREQFIEQFEHSINYYFIAYPSKEK